MSNRPTTDGQGAAGVDFPSLFVAYGFRPFFLMAGLFSPLAILVWLGVYSGVLPPFSAYPPNYWHGHEMLFGFAAAVMAGFFLTAVPNWTGAPPVRGRPLGLLVSIWLAGRFAVWLVPAVPVALAALVDLAFFPALAAVLWPSLRMGSRRNMIFLAVLALLFIANLLFHLEAMGFADTGARGLTLAVDLVALLIAIIGGRVTPAFTANALQAAAEGAGKPGRQVVHPFLLGEAAIVSVAAVAMAELAAPGSTWIGAVALLAALLNGVRMAGWQTRATLGAPLLWVLHLGYGWLVAGLAVKGIAQLTGIWPPALAQHGITIGAMGTMTLAIMSRASLGHTGRPLVAPPLLAVAYVAVTIAALARLGLPLAAPEQYLISIAISGLLWTAAFAIFAALFVPILTRPRIDGRPG